MTEEEKKRYIKDWELADKLEPKILSEPEVKQIHELCTTLLKKYPQISEISASRSLNLYKDSQQITVEYTEAIIGTYGSIRLE